MKKISLLAAVLLFPLIASAQYMGYNPIFHNPEVQKEGNRQIAKAWRQFWKEDLPQFFSGQNGKAAFAPAWVQFTPAAQAVDKRVEMVAKDAAKKARKKQPVKVAGKVFDGSAVAFAFCGGVAEEALEGGFFPQEMQGVLNECQAVAEVPEGTADECVSPTALAQAKDEGKSWFRKNIIDVYLQGCASQAAAADAERVAASETTRGLVDLYLQGCQSQGASYMYQTEMNQKTWEDLSKLWNRFTGWLRNLAEACSR